VNLLLEDVVVAAGDHPLHFNAHFTGPSTGLFGPSGAGKTTLIELVAGLRRPERGRIVLDDVVFCDVARGWHLPPEHRRLGYVPQDGALFPHLSVEGNLRYGARPAARAGQLALSHVCALLGLETLRARPVATLSGGEQQRVAIGRALLAAPRLLLFDEPLTSLDASRKETLLPYLRRVRDALRVPLLYVSHAPAEVQALCDELAVLADGRIAQLGPTTEVFRRPADAAVARIVGVETVHPARLREFVGALAAVQVGPTRLLGLADQLPAGTDEVMVSIRADDVMVVKSATPPPASARNRLPAVVRDITCEGAGRRVELDVGFPLAARLTPQAVAELELAVGSPVYALVKVSAVHLMPGTLPS